MPIDLMERFERHFIPEPNTGCWLWFGSQNSKGYGLFRTGPKKGRAAHRVSYEHKFGCVPADLELDHTCRMRCCVNPDHLEPVTHTENLRRSPSFGGKRTECPKGHPYDEANTRINRRGYRYCLACLQISNAKVTQRRREKRISSNAAN